MLFTLLVVITGSATLLPTATAHGFIKQWSANGVTQKAQKQSLVSSAFRSAPDNTGWIGGKFLTSPAIACGSSQTPFQTVAAPGGTIFGTAGQSAGKTMAVKAGSSVQFVVSGNPGVGWPHPKGHVQTYLAFCGASATACQNFDATKAGFFKIQSETDGISKTLKPAYDASVDGNRYDVTVPSSIAAGSYIMRFELIAFGQSSAAEGEQDQYYPFCGQINVSGGSASAANSFATVKFPGAYQNGNIDQSTTPGPQVLAAGTSTPNSSASGSTGSSSDSRSSAARTSSRSSATGSTGRCSSTQKKLRRERRRLRCAEMIKRHAAMAARDDGDASVSVDA